MSLNSYLNTPFKRLMAVISIIAFAGIAIAFLMQGGDLNRAIYYVFRRYSNPSFGILLMRVSFYVFPVSVLLMLFGEKVWAWNKNGSNSNNTAKK